MALYWTDFAIPRWGVQYGRGYISVLKNVMSSLYLARSSKSSLAASAASFIASSGNPLPAVRSIIHHDYSTSFQIFDPRQEQSTINWEAASLLKSLIW